MAIKLKNVRSNQSLVGKSHWWGAPDLPKEVPYPCVKVQDKDGDYMEPLTFICQIRCRDIASLDSEGILPHTGMLYFFAPINYFLGEHDTPIDYHESPVVVYSEQEDNLTPYELHWEGTTESVFATAEGMSFEHISGHETDGHAMLSIPYMDEIQSTYPDHIALLQIDEEDDWNLRFYDCGMYFIMIERNALANREWGKAVGALYYS